MQEEITLINERGETRSIKTGAALYLLLNFIPLVGSLIVFIMSIIRKQFKFYYLVPLFWGLIFYIPIFILALFLNNSYGEPNLLIAILILILYIAAIVVLIWIYIYNIININKLSIRNALEHGFHLATETPEAQNIVNEALATKYPWFYFKFLYN